jgi:ubiquinone biosynthesis UbiH/UbiF/VisC/COQ6 family hydroxylase
MEDAAMPQDVMVVGAGPAGLCLALALAARGLKVLVLDRQDEQALAEPAYDGREIALTHRSVRLLHELGVWQHLPADAAPVLRRARVMDGAHRGFEVGGEAFGLSYLGRFVSNHLIRRAAWCAAAAMPGIEIRTSVSLESLATDARCARVAPAGGERLEAALLVAADSRFSTTRRALGIPAFAWDLGMTMVLSRVRHEQPNHGVAWEWFGRGQTRALLPVADHEASAVITLPGVEAQSLLDVPDGDFGAKVTARFEGRLGRMTPSSTRHAYPLVATWAARFTGSRCALAGDAAVGMHPVTAHGFNLGLASVERLAQSVGEAVERTGDPGHPDALARYERRHRAGSAPLFAGTQAIAGLFTSPGAWAQPLRWLALSAGGRFPALPRGLAAALLDSPSDPGGAAHWARAGLRALRAR